MVIAKICVDGVTAVASGLSKIPKGIIGATIEVTFGSSWEGLSKTAVIRGAVTKDVLDVGNVIEIPAECVAMTGYNLKVGFYGTAGDTVAIPTIWADLGMVTDAADPSGDTSTDPALPVWAQLQNQVDALKQNGGGGGSGGGGGADGFSPIARVEQTDDGAVITITDKTGTTSATITNGKDGAKGEKGDTGATGATGPQGPKGDTGAQGPQGEQGPAGAAGPAGYTPEKGKDYFTAADKAEIAGMVDVPKGAVLYTAQELTEEQKAQARTNIGAADAESLLPLTEAHTVTSMNLYDPSLQTPETISPHYWFNGAPYSTTQFDSSYHCTAPIPVEPNTTYTVGYFKADGSVGKPWGETGQGVHFFNADGTFLGNTGNNTFTTPSGTAYFRMNYAYQTNIDLTHPDAKCMLVLGNTLPTEYVVFGSYTTASAVDRLARYSPPIQYSIDNNVLKVASHYSVDKDFLVTMNLGRGNGLFDFASFKLIPLGMDIESGEAFAETLMTNGTDWHAPFIVRATENADGDDVGSAYFTGGNHQYNNQGSGSSETARSVSLRFFVDGREVASDKGYANKIEIRWVNNVQGYNTRKADGTGREILQERHRLIFDGIEWSETIELEPLETVFMERWYGLQFVYTPNYPNYRYIGAADRTLHTNEASDCGGKDADGIVAYGDEHKIEMTIDTSVDLGKRTLSGETGALCSDAKAYMFIIDYKQMEAGEVYRLCGGYKFMSA